MSDASEGASPREIAAPPACRAPAETMDRIPLSVLVWLALGFGLSSAVLSFSIDAPGPLDAGLLAVMYASGFGTPAIARDLDIMGLAAIFAVGFAASGALVLATKALGLGVAAPGGAGSQFVELVLLDDHVGSATERGGPQPVA